MRAPDLKSETGKVRAWKIKKPANPKLAAHDGHISSWIVNGPFHLCWSWWMLGVVHLRPIPHVKQPYKQYPGAEYEFLIMAFNPDRGMPDITAIEDDKNWGVIDEPKFLEPADVVIQFDGLDDERAERLCDLSAWAIAKGLLSPDQDYRERWKTVILETVDHLKHGSHRKN